MASRLIVLLVALAVGPAWAARPNVVLLLADDLGWRDLSATGSDFYQTPNIDRLFAEGVHFLKAYASCQVCSPTRASLLTGKTPARHGITDWIGAPMGRQHQRNTVCLPAGYVDALPAGETTLAEAFREAGYATFFAGKWHLGGEGSLPTDHGFQVNKGGHHRGLPPGGYFSPYANPLLEDGPVGEHLPLRLARETCRFIDDCDGPFFTMLSFYSVHNPLETTPERWRHWRDIAVARPQPERRFVFDRTAPSRVVQDHPVYAGMVAAMDDAVGLLLAELERLGIADETIIVFASDNGGVSSGDGRATSNLPLRGGKGFQWEAGLRTPLAIRYPAVAEGGRTVGAPAITCDLYPTLLELCGLPLRPKQHTDGVSLAAAMRGEALPDRPLFWHYPHYSNQGGEPSSIVRRDAWKLIRYHEDGREELYNLDADPGEQNDLAGSEPKRQASLGRLLDAWLEETGAVFPAKNDDYDPVRAAKDRDWISTTYLQQEEQRAAEVLKEDWQPDPTWWGAAPAE